MKATLTCCVCLLLAGGVHVAGAESFAGPPFIRPNDVVALIGGEDMVALVESGQIEAQIVRQPGLGGVKVRALAYEGDTVFEQHRQLNHPSWEEQLEKIGATVVVVQFGKLEVLRTDFSSEEFNQAYEALLKRLMGRERRGLILSPTPFEKPASPLPDLTRYNARLGQLSIGRGPFSKSSDRRFIDLFWSNPETAKLTRDGIHLNDAGLNWTARKISRDLGLLVIPDDDVRLLRLLAEKNRLWFNYHRPQNWAFLHGDRTEQLFSRDYRDTSVRQLPIEMEEYVPLIAAKEREIVAYLRGIPAEKN